VTLSARKVQVLSWEIAVANGMSQVETDRIAADVREVTDQVVPVEGREPVAKDLVADHLVAALAEDLVADHLVAALAEDLVVALAEDPALTAEDLVVAALPLAKGLTLAPSSRGACNETTRTVTASSPQTSSMRSMRNSAADFRRPTPMATEP
jgi:hypothetical protein